MENETVNYNIDLDPLLKEMQTLNEGVVSNGERLDQINEYLILKDKKESEDSEVKAETEQTTRDAEIEASEQQNEQFEELLIDIRLEQQLTNQLITGSFLFYGVIAGILLFKILWDKLT